MDVLVQCDADISMPQNLAEAFHVKSYLDAPGSKGVAERMEMDIPDTAPFHDCFETVLHGSRLNIAGFISSQYISLLV